MRTSEPERKLLSKLIKNLRARGYTNVYIAYLFNISESTVRRMNQM